MSIHFWYTVKIDRNGLQFFVNMCSSSSGNGWSGILPETPFRRCAPTGRLTAIDSDWPRQEQKLLPVTYYLASFTLPKQLRPLGKAPPEMIYSILLSAAAETLKTFARNDPHLAGQLGFASVLYTIAVVWIFIPTLRGEVFLKLLLTHGFPKGIQTLRTGITMASLHSGTHT